MVHPFETCDYDDPDEMAVIDNTIDHWILRGMGQWSEWCYPLAAIIQARMGFKESPAMLLNIWREIFVNEAWSTVYLPRFRGLTAHRRKDLAKPKETHEVFQLDGTCGAISAILEMLIHETGGKVCIFPAVPDAWHDASFFDVAVRYGFRISARRQGGHLTTLTVRSTAGGTIRLVGDGIDGVLRWELKPGETRTQQFDRA